MFKGLVSRIFNKLHNLFTLNNKGVNYMYDQNGYSDVPPWETEVSESSSESVKNESASGEMLPPPAPPAPDSPVNYHIRHLTQEEVESVNTVIREAEKITQAMTKAWEVRDSLRRVVAEMVCPWKRGTVLMINDGRGPQDRKVVVAVLGGATEKGEFFRVRVRVLAKGQTPGRKEMWLKLTPELKVTVIGEFAGVLPGSDWVDVREV